MDDVPGGASLDVALTVNRRCTEEVLLPARLAVAANPRAEPKTLRSGTHGDKPTFSSFPDDGAEARAIAATIKELVAHGTDPGEIACLCRAGWAMRSEEGRVGKEWVRKWRAGGAAG